MSKTERVEQKTHERDVYATSSSVHVFGVRHHGPGCARGLCLALDELQPDIVLVEGPPDAHEVLPLLTQQGMQPPVALLIYVPDTPQRAVFYPFAQFSPEWQALHYASAHAIPARFIDLPQSIQLARTLVEPSELAECQSEESPDALKADEIRKDPFVMMSRAAGFADSELWWEQLIEQSQYQQQTAHIFEGITELMRELRDDLKPASQEEAQREAHMRQAIRGAQEEGFTRIAVVCGAWHAPALVQTDDTPSALSDASLLRGLKRVKVQATWIPWTYSRLAFRSGYGAGVQSPGWYDYLWDAPHHTGYIASRWLTRAAHLLREQGLDASSASIIEAVRLSHALATLRDLSLPGLTELHEAIEAVLCHGNSEPLRLIRDKLEIGERLGTVPDATPAVPLQRDLEQWQRGLRLTPSTERVMLQLDLRKENDLAKSKLLHRLRLLSIAWGKPQVVRGKSGTFHEHWELQWRVEFAVSIIEANIWGNTVLTAATAYVCHQAERMKDLPQLTEMLAIVMLADVPEAYSALLQAIQTCATMTADIRHLMNALPPLARLARYSNVRQVTGEHVQPIIDSFFERIIIGVPLACISLDDDAAREMMDSIGHVQESVALLDNEPQRTSWHMLLQTLVNGEHVHGLLRGWCCRLLLEQRALSQEEFQRLTRLALSPVVPVAQAAAWIEGVLRGNGVLVLHQDQLWYALDEWLKGLAGDVFEALLPVVRRGFSHFQAPERRAMGEKVRFLRQPVQTVGVHEGIDGLKNGIQQPAIEPERAKLVIPVLRQLLRGERAS